MVETWVRIDDLLAAHQRDFIDQPERSALLRIGIDCLSRLFDALDQITLTGRRDDVKIQDRRFLDHIKDFTGATRAGHLDQNPVRSLTRHRWLFDAFGVDTAADDFERLNDRAISQFRLCGIVHL